MNVLCSGSISVLGEDGQSVVANAAYSRTVSGEGTVIAELTLDPAKTGTLTTRTDANTGTLTMDSGHGITTGQTLDVYWADADGVMHSRLGMTVGSVATNSVPIDGGAGDDLPDAATAITAMVPEEQAFAVEGDDVLVLIASCPAPAAGVSIVDDGDAVAARLTLKAAEGYGYAEGNNQTNPVAGDTLATVLLSHSDSTVARKVKVVAVTN